MSKPLAILIGFIGKSPVAGMSMFVLHYVAGLQSLGYEVHYLERLNAPFECYNPTDHSFTDQTDYALAYLEGRLSGFGISRNEYSFIDRENRCHGSGWAGLCAALDRADFVLNLCEATWFDDLERCPLRAFVDGDPLFTQVAAAEGQGPKTAVLEHYNRLFTYGVRIGKPDCTVPAAGRTWIPAHALIATRLWDVAEANQALPVTTVMNWGAWEDVSYDGRVYGHKGREFERFFDLQRFTGQPFELAVGGPMPRERLIDHGWQLLDAAKTTLNLENYRRFIASSKADFGIAKHAYVASRCGWFSDRSTCYLASGRPVLHQDTGFGDWLPTGEGVLKFSEVADVLECLRRLDLDYACHSRAARQIAEEHFEAATVLGKMLDQAGLR
jgi:hypothetical protein